MYLRPRLLRAAAPAHVVARLRLTRRAPVESSLQPGAPPEAECHAHCQSNEEDDDTRVVRVILHPVSAWENAFGLITR